MNSPEPQERRNEMTHLGKLLGDSSLTKPEPTPPGSEDAECWCGGSGFRIRAIGSLQLRVACPCPIGQDLLQRVNAEIEAKLAQEAEADRADTWAAAEIPERFRDVSLTAPPLPASLVKAMTAEPEIGSWLLYGEPGRGKTGAAIGYARLHMYHISRRVLFRSVPALLGEIRSTYGGAGFGGRSEADLMNYYSRVPLLILDDLGAEQITGNGWVDDRLYQIVSGRHGDMRPTIFTSNHTPAELLERLGARITDRIFELCGRSHIVNVTGPNLRQA